MNLFSNKKNGDSKKHLRAFAAFTLIELIVVIAIIGILAAIIIPVAMGYVRDARRAAVVAEAKILTDATTNALIQWHVVEGNALNIEKMCKITSWGGTKWEGAKPVWDTAKRYGNVTNYMFKRAQDYKGGSLPEGVTDSNKVDFYLAEKILKYIDSNSKEMPFYKFSVTADQRNPWGMSLAEFERKFPGAPALALVYNDNAELVYLAYGKGGIIVEYRLGEYRIMEDNPRFPSDPDTPSH